MAALEQALAQCKEQKLKVLTLVGVAGSTDFGSIDPLPELADIAEREQIHFHVDAAWGGPTLFSHRYQALLAGIERADTVTLDGHKQLLVPLGTGMLLCRQPDLMMAVKREAPYAIRASSFDQGRFTLEGTRPANALYLDAAFQLFGQQGYAELIEANYDRARLMASLIDQSPAFELMSTPVMNLLSYRCIPLICRAKYWTRLPTNRSIPSMSPCRRLSAPRGTVLSPAPSAPWVATARSRSPCCGPCCSIRSSKSATSAICWRISSG